MVGIPFTVGVFLLMLFSTLFIRRTLGVESPYPAAITVGLLALGLGLGLNYLRGRYDGER